MKYSIVEEEDYVKIDNRFILWNTFAYDKKHKILFIADTHIGLEEYYRQQGTFIPRILLKDLKEKTLNALKKFDVKKIILLGDVKHEFGTISKQEWFETKEFFEIIKNYEIILIKGNHDTILKPISEKFQFLLTEVYNYDDVLVLHGDKEFNVDKKIKYILIGHEHPAISLRRFTRVEKFKCFLLGEHKKKKLFVLPSSHIITEGTDVLKENLLSPLIKNLENFEVIIVADRLYYFGKIKDILELLKEFN
ncbi:MAG: metallophosphoesterase [Candidatus Woesearchaeota archaeon]